MVLEGYKFYISENGVWLIEHVPGVFLKYRYVYLTQNAIPRRIRKGCRAIGILCKSSHKIRKTYVSALVDSSLNIDEIRRQAGHASEKTTYDNYCFNRKTNEETEI